MIENIDVTDFYRKYMYMYMHSLAYETEYRARP